MDLCSFNDWIILNNPHQPPSYFSVHGTGYPDLTIASPDIANKITNWEVSEEESLSDHRYITFALDYNVQTTQKTNFKTKHGKLGLFTKLCLPMLKSLEGKLEEISTVQQIDNLLNEFYTKLHFICQKSFRQKSNNAKLSLTWFTPELRAQRNKLRALSKKLTRNPAQQIRIVLRRERAKYKRAILSAKRNAWRSFCSASAKSFGKAFDIMRQKSFNNENLVHISLEGMPLQSTHLEVEQKLLRHHFSSSNQSSREVEVQQSCFPAINFYELKQSIKSQNLNKAPGTDKFDPRIVNYIFKIHPNFLLALFNKLLQISYFPHKWKEAIVVFFYKQNKPSALPSSYRPICLLQSISKIFERIINNRILFHLNQNFKLAAQQFGFIEGKSTTLCINSLLQEINKRNNKFKYTLLVSFDISGAFDNVDWQILLHELGAHNLDKYLQDICKSFLTNRKVGVLDGDLLKGFYTTKGCPQGSCLAPLFWNIIANKVLTSMPQTDCFLIAYADDFALLVSEDSRSRLEQLANHKIQQFASICNDLNLQISSSKTIGIVFGKNIYKRIPSIKLNNTNIKIEKKIKYLGIILDNNLNFLPHLDYLDNQISALVINTNRTSSKYWGVRPLIIKTWYTTVIEAKLLYAAPAWFPHLNSHGRRKLISIQRKYLIKILQAYHQVSNQALYTLTGVPPITTKLKQIVNFFNFKYCSGLLTIDSEILSSSQMERTLLKSFISPFSFPTNIIFKNIKDGLPSQIPGTITIYTDGSKSSSGVGLAFVALTSNHTLQNFKLHINSQSSVFQAEALAIQEAIKWACSRPETSFLIYSDSFSVLQSLQNLTPKSPQVRQILIFCNQHPSKSFTFSWVKAHVQIPGNELADSLAKEAIHLSEIKNIPFPQTYIKMKLKTQILDSWQLDWTNATTGRHTFKIFNTVDFDLKFHNKVLTYFATNQGSFPSYLHKIAKLDTPNCPCGASGDALHFLLESCSFSPHYIKRSPTESLKNLFLRIDSSQFLLSLSSKIYNHLNENYSFIVSSVLNR